MRPTLIEDLSIVIPAAGQGERLGLGPKALLMLDGHSLLYWISAKARTMAAEVIVAAPPDAIPLWAMHCPDCRVIEGGASHLESMARLARAATLPWLMNMNISMPFTSPCLMRKVALAARQGGISGAFLQADLPVAQVKDGMVSALMARQDVAVAQGPNAYSRQILLRLIDAADADDWRRQSFLEIAVRHGQTIHAVAGEKSNMKITSPQDWKLAQYYKELLQ